MIQGAAGGETVLSGVRRARNPAFHCCRFSAYSSQDEPRAQIQRPDADATETAPGNPARMSAGLMTEQRGSASSGTLGVIGRGERETFARDLAIRPRLVAVCLRNERQKSGDCDRKLQIFQCRASALPLLGERVGMKGNEATSDRRRTTVTRTAKLREPPGRAGGFPIRL
jgi:hypothetical protein